MVFTRIIERDLSQYSLQLLPSFCYLFYFIFWEYLEKKTGSNFGAKF